MMTSSQTLLPEFGQLQGCQDDSNNPVLSKALAEITKGDAGTSHGDPVAPAAASGDLWQLADLQALRGAILRRKRSANTRVEVMQGMKQVLVEWRAQISGKKRKAEEATGSAAAPSAAATQALPSSGPPSKKLRPTTPPEQSNQPADRLLQHTKASVSPTSGANPTAGGARAGSAGNQGTRPAPSLTKPGPPQFGEAAGSTDESAPSAPRDTASGVSSSAGAQPYEAKADTRAGTGPAATDSEAEPPRGPAIKIRTSAPPADPGTAGTSPAAAAPAPPPPPLPAPHRPGPGRPPKLKTLQARNAAAAAARATGQAPPGVSKGGAGVGSVRAGEGGGHGGAAPGAGKAGAGVGRKGGGEVEITEAMLGSPLALMLSPAPASAWWKQLDLQFGPVAARHQAELAPRDPGPLHLPDAGFHYSWTWCLEDALDEAARQAARDGSGSMRDPETGRFARKPAPSSKTRDRGPVAPPPPPAAPPGLPLWYQTDTAGAADRAQFQSKLRPGFVQCLMASLIEDEGAGAGGEGGQEGAGARAQAGSSAEAAACAIQVDLPQVSPPPPHSARRLESEAGPSKSKRAGLETGKDRAGSGSVANSSSPPVGARGLHTSAAEPDHVDMALATALEADLMALEAVDGPVGAGSGGRGSDEASVDGGAPGASGAVQDLDERIELELRHVGLIEEQGTPPVEEQETDEICQATRSLHAHLARQCKINNQKREHISQLIQKARESEQREYELRKARSDVYTLFCACLGPRGASSWHSRSASALATGDTETTTRILDAHEKTYQACKAHNDQHVAYPFETGPLERVALVEREMKQEAQAAAITSPPAKDMVSPRSHIASPIMHSPLDPSNASDPNVPVGKATCGVAKVGPGRPRKVQLDGGSKMGMKPDTSEGIPDSSNGGSGTNSNYSRGLGDECSKILNTISAELGASPTNQGNFAPLQTANSPQGSQAASNHNAVHPIGV